MLLYLNVKTSLKHCFGVVLKGIMGQPWLVYHYVDHFFDKLGLFLETLLFCCFPWHALCINARLVVDEEIRAKASGSVFEEEDEQPPEEDDQEPTLDRNFGRDAAGAEDAAAAAEPPGN